MTHIMDILKRIKLLVGGTADNDGDGMDLVRLAQEQRLRGGDIYFGIDPPYS
jgi:hypothetical protein